MLSQTRSYVITTLLTQPADDALGSLANVKDDLDITTTSNDARLTRYIEEISAEIARHCNRIFGLATWQDEFRPQRGIWGEGVRAPLNPLTLTHYPLASTGVSFTGNTNSSTVISNVSSITGLDAGMPIFGTGISPGTTISSANASAIVISQPATATAADVALVAGIQVTEIINGTATILVPGTDYEVQGGSLLPGDEGTAMLYRLNEAGNPRTWPPAQIIVIYQAGYSLPDDAEPNLPADLQRACERMVVARYRARTRDPALRALSQPGLGSEQFMVPTFPSQRGPYPNDIMDVLSRYRVPVVA